MIVEENMAHVIWTISGICVGSVAVWISHAWLVAPWRNLIAIAGSAVGVLLIVLPFFLD